MRHTGKDAKRGMRGHSVLLGAIDTAIEVTRHEDDHRECRVAKQRDGERGGFQLVRVELPDDADGRPVHSVAIEEIDLPESQDGVARAPIGKNQRLALDILTDHLADLQEAIKGLVATGVLIEQDGHLLRLEDADDPDELPDDRPFDDAQPGMTGE